MRYELCGMKSSTDQHIKGRRVIYTKTFYDTTDYADALYALGRYMRRTGANFAILDGGEAVAYGSGKTVYITTPSGQKTISLGQLSAYCQLLRTGKAKIRQHLNIPEPEPEDTTEGMTDLEQARRKAFVNRVNKDRKRGEGLTGAERYEVLQAKIYGGRAGVKDALRKIKRNRELRDRQYGRSF